jgi:HK97 family phage prohead protease
MKTMIAPAQVKAVDSDDEPGTFEAIVSVYGNVDQQGERVVDGAFDAWLTEFRAAGDPLPIVWSHQWGDAKALIGYADPADIRSEPGVGLVVKGHLDVDEETARIVHRHMKRRSIRQFSFAFDVLEDGRGDDGVPELRQLAVHEAGPCLLGVNTATDLLAVKATNPETAKARVQLAGSVEQRLDGIRSAWQGWAVEAYGDDLYACWVEATFDDHIVGYAESWDDPLDGGTFDLVATAVPKSATPGWRATRAHRAAAKAGTRPAPGSKTTTETDPPDIPAKGADDLRTRLSLITADV